MDFFLKEWKKRAKGVIEMLSFSFQIMNYGWKEIVISPSNTWKLKLSNTFGLQKLCVVLTVASEQGMYMPL